jgi:hypothetical protein
MEQTDRSSRQLNTEIKVGKAMEHTDTSTRESEQVEERKWNKPIRTGEKTEELKR